MGIDASGTRNKDATINAFGYVRAPFSTNYISRHISSVFAKTNFIFAKAIIAKKHIRVGKGSLIDSFDSTSNTYSTGGAYDAAKRKAGGTLATVSDKNNSIKIDGTKVYGDASVADGGGVQFGGGGTLGDQTWVDGGNKGAQTGKISTGYQYDFAPIQAPWSSGGITPTGGQVSGVTYQVFKQGNATLQVIDLRTMKVIGQHKVGDTPDVLAWDPEWRRLYVAAEGGLLSAFWLDGTTLHPVGEVRLPHAHTVSVDPRTHRVYLPLEDIEGKPVLRIYQPAP